MKIDYNRIEATQAIQRQRTMLRDPRFGEVPLVAGKRTVLRIAYEIFVPAGLSRQYVVGSLYGLAGFALHQVPGPFGPETKVVGSGGHRHFGGKSNWDDLGSTLQVVLPPLPPGRIDLSLLLITYGRYSGAVEDIQEIPITLEFHERRLIRVRLVRIGPNAPQLDQFWMAAEVAQRILPLPEPGFVVVADSVVNYDGSFERIDNGAYDTAWPGYAKNAGSTGHIPSIMDGLVALEARPPDVVYVGIFTWARFNGADLVNGPHAHRDRWLVVPNPFPFNRMMLANEIAHLHGFPLNAPCGNPGPLDPDFPDGYNLAQDFPSGSISEYGLDPYDLAPFQPRIYDPNTTFDLMTACEPRWISVYTVKKVFGALAPLPPDEPPPASFLPRPGAERVVRVSFLELHGDWVEVGLPNLPRPNPPPPPGPPPPFEFYVLMFDGQGQMLGRFPATATPGDGLDLGQRVEADIPWRDDVAALVLTAAERTLAEVRIARAPLLEARFPTAAELEAGGGVVEWSVETSGERLLVGIRASEDAGRTWTTFHLTGEPRGCFDLSAALAREGAAFLVEVVASTGFHYRSKTVGPFGIRARPRAVEAMVLTAASGEGAMLSPLELFAIPDARPDPIRWTSDVDGPLGTGDRVRATLSPGPHVIEARSTRAFEAPAYLKVEVEADGDEGPQHELPAVQRDKAP
jgi:hypothetical protein